VWGATQPTPLVLAIYNVSIHAPRVGRDWCLRQLLKRYAGFNPRAPCGARRPKASPTCARNLFQSTRPVWGATLAVRALHWRFSSFNPRAPCGARL